MFKRIAFWVFAAGLFIQPSLADAEGLFRLQPPKQEAPASPSPQVNEDQQLLCPVLSPTLASKVWEQVKGHGICPVVCKGCGCKGGPGYRGPNGKCVGYHEIISACGPPPHQGCTPECAIVRPGCTGRAWIKDLAKGLGLTLTFVKGVLPSKDGGSN